MLWLSAMKLTRSTASIANLIFLSPMASLLLIHLIVGEAILPSTLLGLALILGGLLAQKLRCAASSRSRWPTAVLIRAPRIGRAAALDPAWQFRLPLPTIDSEGTSKQAP
ncbi:Uncharacterised protein [Chromobacterium violaceum]|uniref:EamA domain-containing protein n=1 Tax=Chromobacterium violaceum TaxID=536 RepID=A0A447THM3_CHRVL|nr:Uncharacterised protein [Chromobacterium violaceum]